MAVARITTFPQSTGVAADGVTEIGTGGYWAWVDMPLPEDKNAASVQAASVEGALNAAVDFAIRMGATSLGWIDVSGERWS